MSSKWFKEFWLFVKYKEDFGKDGTAANVTRYRLDEILFINSLYR